MLLPGSEPISRSTKGTPTGPSHRLTCRSESCAATATRSSTRPGRSAGQRKRPGRCLSASRRRPLFLTGHEAEIAALVAADSAEGPPYRSLPGRSFWRTAVAEPDPDDIGDLWQPRVPPSRRSDPHGRLLFFRRIGRAMLEAGMNWYDAEPPPPALSVADRAARRYGEFSFRTGNVYTAASLRQWLAWASGAAVPPDATWEEDGRHFDPYRPAVTLTAIRRRRRPSPPGTSPWTRSGPGSAGPPACSSRSGSPRPGTTGWTAPCIRLVRERSAASSTSTGTSSGMPASPTCTKT